MSTDLINCRVLDHESLPGAQNMAVDAEMLERAVNGGATVRTYQWSEPTVSLGHFQAKTLGNFPDRFSNLPVVERLSGGGAILHDRELTYSLAIPKTHELTQNPSQIYNEIHDCVIDLLSSFGIVCQMRGNAAFAEKPFLCFGRGDERDIVIGTHKIVGSAQRRRQGAVLQHGSILLKQSEYAPEFPGIEDLTMIILPPDSLASQLRERIIQKLNLQPLEE
ncbi:lipoate--protein ligase family protein [bacterium]|jgi:lipoyl(octanoyl) transferase|nr:lipoate--protein ligase family protein [bacterium]MDA7527439.1 lipoate--protein ligase family protein [bacterium]